MAGEGPDSLFVGQRIIRLDQVDSTNNFALGILKGMPLEEGVVITTSKQTRGKGQRGNSWESEPGQNITCSIVLRPKFIEPAFQFDLTRAISLALVDVLNDLIPGNEIKIKWPNDIYVNGSKVAGILIESLISGSVINYSVAGIGFNVNQTEFIASGVGATSLKLISGQQFELQNVLRMICAAVEARYLQLRGGNISDLRRQYFNSVFKAGVKTRFTDFNSVFEAVIVDVTPEGLLVVADEYGVKRNFAMKEIGWIG